jgi:hypothetical protein
VRTSRGQADTSIKTRQQFNIGAENRCLLNTLKGEYHGKNFI